MTVFAPTPSRANGSHLSRHAGTARIAIASVSVLAMLMGSVSSASAFGFRGGARIHAGPAMHMGHPSGFDGGGMHPPSPGPHPTPGPGPSPTPGPHPPGPGPNPGPGPHPPGPGPGPGPGPHPPGPPPPGPHPPPYYPGWYDWYGAAAVGAAVALTTTAIIGSMVASLPENCVATTVNGVTYEHCDTVWYRPEYVGSSVQYVVVETP